MGCLANWPVTTSCSCSVSSAVAIHPSIHSYVCTHLFCLLDIYILARSGDEIQKYHEAKLQYMSTARIHLPTAQRSPPIALPPTPLPLQGPFFFGVAVRCSTSSHLYSSSYPKHAPHARENHPPLEDKKKKMEKRERVVPEGMRKAAAFPGFIFTFFFCFGDGGGGGDRRIDPRPHGM